MGQSASFEVKEVTDSLEALGVFRLWKNVFLVVIIFSMLATQASFWLIDLGLVDPAPEPGSGSPVVVEADASADNNAGNIPGDVKAPGFFGVTLRHLGYVLRIGNGTAMLGAILYCLTLQFCIMITVMAKLGGLQYVCRAFFWGLVMLILLLPWQHILDASVLGALYGPDELIQRCLSKLDGLFPMILHYLRFCGLWLLCLLLLLMSQIKCVRWAKDILRRLEII